MSPTHSGALQVTRESLAFLRSAINDLPQEALEWKPLPSANSLSVLVVHAVTSSRFFLSAGSGQVGSMAAYRSTERAEAFKTTGVAKAHLLAMIDAFAVEAEGILAAGNEQHVESTVLLPTNDGLLVPDRNGAGTLFAAIAHLREHVGHVQLMHDLWLAR